MSVCSCVRVPAARMCPCTRMWGPMVCTWKLTCVHGLVCAHAGECSVCEGAVLAHLGLLLWLLGSVLMAGAVWGTRLLWAPVLPPDPC